MMLDQEDREALLSVGLEWGLRLILALAVVFGASLTFGIALRLFEAVRG